MDTDDAADAWHRPHGDKRRRNSSGRGVTSKLPQRKKVSTMIGDSLAFDLSKDGIKHNVLLETLIAECLLNHPEVDVFEKPDDTTSQAFTSARLEFAHPEGDILSTLTVIRRWTTHLTYKTPMNTWYKKNCINERALRFIESYVDFRYGTVRQENYRCGKLVYMQDVQMADAKIYTILCKHLADNICIYNGHKSLGYKLLKTRQNMGIHQNSSLHFLGRMPSCTLALPFHFRSDENAQLRYVVIKESDAKSIYDLSGEFENVLQPVNIPICAKAAVTIIKTLWKSHYLKHPSILEVLKSESRDSPFILEANESEVTVEVYSLSQYHGFVQETLEKYLEIVNDILRNETLELHAFLTNSPMRFLLGPGGQPERLLLPFEFRYLQVRDATKDQSLTYTEVLDTLSIIGNIKQITESCSRDKALGKWGVVTFENPDDAVKALSLRHDENFMIELLSAHDLEFEEFFTPLVGIDHSLTVSVQMCRRPVASGRAFIRVPGKRDYAQILNRQCITIDSHRISIKPCKATKDKLMLDGLPMNIKEKSISDAIWSSFGINPAEIHLDYIPPFASTTSELASFRSVLTYAIDKVSNVNKVNIQIFTPEARDVYITGELRFENARIAISAMDRLCVQKPNNGTSFEVLATPDDVKPSIRFNVDNRIFNILESDIMKRCKLALKTGEHVTVMSGKQSQHVIRVTGPTVRGVELTASKLEELLAPAKYKPTFYNYNYFTRSSGLVLLDYLMKETNTYIHLNTKERAVCVYGSKLQKVELIKTLSKDYNSSSHQLDIINLNSSSLPPDTLIKTIKKFGSKLEKLNKETEEKQSHVTTMLNIDEKAIVISYKNPFGVDREMKTAFKERILSDLGIETNLSHTFTCSICFAEIVNVCETVKLQTCGHVYCLECARNCIKYAVPERQLPLTCEHEDCGVPYCIRDVISHCIQFLKGGLQKLAEVTRDVFIKNFHEEYMYCHNAGCYGVVPKEKGAEVFICPLCYGKQCGKCMFPYHRGYTCEEYKVTISITTWMEESTNRKYCPNCQMGIEKISGCNNVYCIYCNRNICWVCLKDFPNANECYHHLNDTHGNIY